MKLPSAKYRPFSPGPLQLLAISYNSIGIMTCISNCIHVKQWCVITHICQAIIWTNAGILLIGPLWTNFSEISIESITFSFKKMHLKMSSGKWRAFFLGLNVIIQWCLPGMTSTHRVMNAQFLTPRGVVHCSRNGALRWLFHSLLAQP